MIICVVYDTEKIQILTARSFVHLIDPLYFEQIVCERYVISGHQTQSDILFDATNLHEPLIFVL